MTNFLHFSPTEYTYGQYITFIRKNFQSCRLSTIILRVVLLHTKYIPESSSEDNEIQKRKCQMCWRIQHQENYELYSCSYYRDTNQITGNNTLSKVERICKPTTTIPQQCTLYNCALIIESCLGYQMKIVTNIFIQGCVHFIEMS